MTFGPANSRGNYLPVEFQLENDPASIKDEVASRERLTASLLNQKEHGQYSQAEIQTNQAWFPTNQSSPNVERNTFRKTFDVVQILGKNVSTGVNTIFHNITGLKTPTRIFGTATDTTGMYYTIPFYDPATTHGISVTMDSKNVNINNNVTNNLTQCYITIEYTKS